MANYCNYEIRVKGSRNAGLMVYESMPSMDFKDYEWKTGSGKATTICFTGDCKWSVNYGVNDTLNRVDVDSMSESEIEDKGTDYWEYSLRAKSEAFQCEIMVHYWSEESGFDQFDHYKNGKVIKKRKIGYNYEEENVFDWDKTEFVGHEGEYDASVDGEQQNENFMSMLMGLGGMADSTESDLSDEDQEELTELLGMIGELKEKAKEIAEKEGIDLDAGPIGETGFDMYQWTFTEGKVATGDGWTIAIPDGFVQRKSNEVDPISGNERLFELVPETYEDEADYNDIPVRILPGAKLDMAGLSYDVWKVHPFARAGAAGVMAYESAKLTSQVTGRFPELLSVGWSDVAAYIFVNDTFDWTYSYQCSVINGKQNQQLRVQTGYITDVKKHRLDLSVQDWLKTMKFAKPNKECPTKTKFEEKACYDELIKGKTTKFDEAVAQAQKEYQVAVAGKFAMLDFMAENDLITENIGESLRDILEKSMEVKLFFLEKADQIIEKLQKNNADETLLETVFDKLTDLDEDYLHLAIHDEEAEIQVSEEVQAIRDKWKKIAPNVYSPAKKEVKARMKAIEERKKARTERENADKTATELASDIKSRMKTIENIYEADVLYHKSMIEIHTFEGPWDPRIREYFSKFDDDIQKLGSNTEELLIEALNSYNEIYEKATPKVAILIIQAIEDAIEYVQSSCIQNDDLHVTFKYDWRIDVSKIRSELRRAKKELKEMQKTFEKEEKKQEKEELRFEEAQKYGIAEKDLNKHKKYLAAKEKYQKAKKSTDFNAASIEFSGVKGYLDADKLKAECDEKSEKLKQIEIEERRKAEEARKKAEEEAKAKREEALRKYDEAYTKWELDCETVKKQRSTYVDELIAKKTKELEAEATQKHDETVTSANATIEEQTERKAAAEVTFASLGFFSFVEKKKQKMIIDDSTKSIRDAQQAIIDAESSYKTEMSEAADKAKEMIIQYRTIASKKFPMPIGPEEPVY